MTKDTLVRETAALLNRTATLSAVPLDAGDLHAIETNRIEGFLEDSPVLSAAYDVAFAAQGFTAFVSAVLAAAG